MTIHSAAGPIVETDRAAALLEPLTGLVIEACAAILTVDRRTMTIDGKDDGSPVTEADLKADRIIAEGLARLAPDLPTLSEERAREARPSYRDSFFLIDPLDGTREFVEGRDEFTVNLALVTRGEPLLGIVGAPALGVVWRGVVGHGAQRITLAQGASRIQAVSAIRTRPLPRHGAPWVAAVSRSHGDAATDRFITERPGAIRQTLGSAVKFGHVAEGLADIYPRLAPTCEWDVGAGHAVVTAAGGKVTDREGAALRFGGVHPGFIVPDFIVWGDPSAARRC